MNKNIIVFGGAGYIGSHAVVALKDAGYSPIIYDNFSYGNRDIAAALEVPVIDADVTDRAALQKTFSEYQPQAVMHFAAFAYVGESVTDPAKYYENNLSATIILLDEMRKASINRFVFSSTCATYGMPDKFPIDETVTQSPVNPYGRTKLMVEQVLADYQHAYGLQSVIFRYFNAAGAHPNGLIGERHNPETHLIPLTLLATNGTFSLQVFGDDYETEDGTCVRDYIHVCDIASAHVKGLELLLQADNKKSHVFNIGTGNGYSVKQIIDSVERITGKKVSYEMKPRRAGDPPKLVAAAQKLRTMLGWEPKFSDLDSIIGTAWQWFLREG